MCVSARTSEDYYHTNGATSETSRNLEPTQCNSFRYRLNKT